MTLVVVKHSLTGEVRSRELNVTKEQIERWQKGELIQNVMPHLTPEEREFLITGLTEEEWEEITESFPDMTEQPSCTGAWDWKMDFCKRHRLPPAQDWAWKLAEKAYLKYIETLQNTQEQNDGLP